MIFFHNKILGKKNIQHQEGDIMIKNDHNSNKLDELIKAKGLNDLHLTVTLKPIQEDYYFFEKNFKNCSKKKKK